MKTGFLITARLKSERLPKKLLLEVHGVTIIAWMIRRLKLSNSLDEIIVCTSTNPKDDPLERIAKEEGVRCFRGSEEDVITRLYDATRNYDLDYVVNITADCPLLPFDLIENLLDQYKKSNADLITCHHLPVGMYLTGIKPEAMKRVLEMKASGFTEYWLYYFLKTDFFIVEELKTDSSLLRDGYRLALDYKEDWELISSIFNQIGPSTYSKTSPEILSFLDNNAELAKINQNCNAKGIERTKQDNTSAVKLKDGTTIL